MSSERLTREPSRTLRRRACYDLGTSQGPRDRLNRASQLIQPGIRDPETMRASIYARYSTDKQSESSLVDQYAVCDRRAQLESLEVVARWGDEATSGSTLVESRPQGRLVMASAREGRFDVLLLESLDRLSRDAVEQETILRRLEHWGIRIIGVSDGYDSRAESRKVTRAVRGLINDIYLDDLRKKTHRGLSGRVDRGMSAGGVSFGYRSVKGEGGSSIEVLDSAAKWVSFIFAEFASGRSIQKIAHELNKLGVDSPRGKGWGVSAIYGSPNKGAGILNNELYVGRYIWNRSQWLMDPDTRKRERVERPRGEWRIIERPDLRLIDDATWSLVRARIDAKDLKPAKGRGRPARTLFGGQLRCPACGGAIIAVNKRAYGCARRKDQGPTACANGSSIRRDIIDERLLDIVREEVLSDAAVLRFETLVRDGLRKELDEPAELADPRETKRQIAKLEVEIGRLVDAIVAHGISDSLSGRLKATEARNQELHASLRVKLDKTVDTEVAVRQAMVEYKDLVANMRKALESDVDVARESLRQLLGRVTISVDGEGAVWAEPEMKTGRIPCGTDLSLNMVARAGFEPATFGL